MTNVIRNDGGARIACAACLGAALLSLGAAPTFSQELPLGADIVVMGEEHDVPEHHLNQARWINALRPEAVVFEMLPADLGPVATEMAGAPPEELSPALQWEARGWPDFEIHAPVFAAAADARVVGAEVARADLSRAMSEGAAVAFDGASFDLSEPLPEDERVIRMAEQAEAHCGLLPEEMLPGMVEAQRLRDAMLAQAASDALDETGGPVAVITGNGHARTDRGVPALLARARPDLSVWSIGQLTSESDAPFDKIVTTAPPADRDADPCATLR